MKFFKTNPASQVKNERKKHSGSNKQAITNDDRYSKRRNQRIDEIEIIFPQCKNILCVGARGDREVQDFINRGYQAIGIDVCNETHFIRRIDAHTIQDNFTENEFDVVYACHSLEHMHDALSVMKQIRHVSKSGCVVTLPFGPPGNVPCIGHPTIFDIMIQCPEGKTIHDITTNERDDFNSFGKFELVKFHRATDTKEINLYFRWL